MGSFSGPGMCIEFVDMSTLMSMRLNVICLGRSKDSNTGFGVGRERDEEGGGIEFSGDMMGGTMGLFKAMNESREKQRTHVRRDLPLVSFASGGGKVLKLSGMAVRRRPSKPM